MCRMCVVEIDTGRGPALQPACMIPVAPDMVVDTESEVTKKAQDGVLEFLLDQPPARLPGVRQGRRVPAAGPDHVLRARARAGSSRRSATSRSRSRSATSWPSTASAASSATAAPASPSDVAGDTLIHFQDRGNQTQVNTFPDHPFASYFSGNTVQICPVGALTATPYRFKARPWDLDQVESTCTTCSVGCRIVVQSSRNEILRYQGVDIDPVNWGWLCDKGRFGFESVNSDDRLGAPLGRARATRSREVPWGEALSTAAAAHPGAPTPDRVAVLGGARLTNEDAYAWAKLAKGVIGTDNVDAQLGDGLPAEVVLGLPRATIDEACAPGRHRARCSPPTSRRSCRSCSCASATPSSRDGVTVVELAPQRTLGVRAGRRLAAAPARRRRRGRRARCSPAAATRRSAASSPSAIAAAAALLGRRPGHRRPRPAERRPSRPTASSPPPPRSTPPTPRCASCRALRRGNVHGALDMGLAPGLLPGRITPRRRPAGWFHDGGWATRPRRAPGLDATGILEAAAAGKIDVLVLLGADPLADFPDRDLATRGARRRPHGRSPSTGSSPRRPQQADVVLAAAGFAEVDGTTTNLEGRVSTVARKITPPGTARDDWMIAAELARLLGTDLGLESAAQILEEIAALAPSHAGLTLARLQPTAS